jgi:predicted transcriptional regulator
MPKAVISVRVDANVLAELTKLAGNRRTTRSKVIEKVLAGFVRQGRIAQNLALGSEDHVG